MKHMIAGGIVLYNPNIERLKENIDAILPQVEKLYIIDNNSNNIRLVEQQVQNYDKVRLKKNSENLGIAKALNQMCNLAISDDYEWILTLDQDTICPSRIISKFFPFTQDYNNVIICPQFLIQGQKLKIADHKKRPYEYIDLCITSASLTRLATWKKLEGYNDWLFIDCVDYDYCIRAKRLGGKIIRINDVIIDHQVGEPKIIRGPFGIEINIYNHSPFRNYYIVRNNIYLLKYYWKELDGFKWLSKFVYFELVKLLFERNKKSTFISICNGFRDGLAINRK